MKKYQRIMLKLLFATEYEINNKYSNLPSSVVNATILLGLAIILSTATIILVTYLTFFS